jgi:hypothetical protein
VTIRLFIDGDRAGRQLRTNMDRNKRRVLAARRGAAQDVIDYVVPNVRADIRKAGNFGVRWTDGFQAKVTEGGGFIRIAFTQSVPYWRVFQHGATISGKPMLWIPLSFAQDAKGKKASEFPGKLFRVDRKVGAPLLLSYSDKQPKYFGKESVRIPKKFRTIEIIKEGSRKMREFFQRRMRASQ